MTVLDDVSRQIEAIHQRGGIPGSVHVAPATLREMSLCEPVQITPTLFMTNDTLLGLPVCRDAEFTHPIVLEGDLENDR